VIEYIMNGFKQYSDAELENLLDDVESDRVERKRSFKNEGEDARQVVYSYNAWLTDIGEEYI